MEQMPPWLSPAEAGVRVELIAPRAVDPMTAARLAYRLTDAAGAPLTDVVVSHEQPMHLIAVRSDLEHFQHVHPKPTGRPSEYAIEVTFPTAGSYILYDEFARASGQDIVQRDELIVGAPSDPSALIENLSPKTIGNIRVALHSDGPIRAGQAARLTFHLTDARTGQSLADLKPYLGAAAHVVILTEGARTFAHTHGESLGTGSHHGPAGDTHGGAQSGHGPAETIGPEVTFQHTFLEPGLYRVWGQFQAADGQLITADFIVRAD